MKQNYSLKQLSFLVQILKYICICTYTYIYMYVYMYMYAYLCIESYLQIVTLGKF